jgi:cytochrome c
MRVPPAIIALAVSACVCILLSGCTGGQTTSTYSIASVGNAQHGKELIRSYGCGACHIVPGIHTARGLVGPPLFDFSERTMIAGELPNTPANLVRWIENPQNVEPKTAMPNLGVNQEQAYDIAAYLYTLRGQE